LYPLPVTTSARPVDVDDAEGLNGVDDQQAVADDGADAGEVGERAVR
jgi:hypothetical protein